MARSGNAQLAADLYVQLAQQHRWSAETAWQGIAILLLTCEVWRMRWEPFHDVVTYIDSNRFAEGEVTLRRAENLTIFLARELNVTRGELCQSIATYWRQPAIRTLQPHNLVGHAFRSLITTALARFGDPEITYEEEADPSIEFPGHMFQTRSRRARIDIVARRHRRTVALLSIRWRVRHDRLDVVDEALAYVPALRRQNPNGRFYAVLGEFDGGRLRKVLSNCPPENPNAAISAAVHFAPQLIREGLAENGSLVNLRGLNWLIQESFHWQ